jgi:soluble lytic murein transglycosylase
VYDLRSAHPDLFGLITEEDFLAEGRLLVKERDDTGLEKIIASYTAKFPAGHLHPEILKLLADTYRKEKKTTQAISLLQEITAYYPRSPAAPEALHTWGTILWNQDKDREALKLFQRMWQRYPDHILTASSLYAIGRIYQEEGTDALAAEAYTKLAARFPQSPLAQEGEWRQGWMAYRRDDFHLAQTLFGRLARQAVGTTSGKAALYWQARSAERAEQPDRATRLYQELLHTDPDSYYSLWAEKRLNVPLTSLALDNIGSTPVGNLIAFTPEARSHLLRGQELKALGLLSLARRELNAFANALAKGRPQDSAFPHLLLREYTSVDDYAAALRLAQGRGQPGSGRWQEYLYPRAYWQTVNTLARQKGLDPYLILALMRQESLFDPEAASPAGALGLMQLLPTTAAKLTPAPLSLTDPNVNLDLGITYLRGLLPPYNGNLILALAAYNAGEEAVERWQRRYPGLEPDEFVESLSFRETRNYVKLVLRNYRTYLRLYGKSQSVPLQWPVAAGR